MLVTTAFAFAVLLLLILAIDALLKKFQHRTSAGKVGESGSPSPTQAGDTGSGAPGTDASNHHSSSDAGGHHGGFSGHGGYFGGGGFGGHGH